MRLPSVRGTLAVSWGPSGGFYLHPRRVCLGRVALTYVPNLEVDDLMEAYVAEGELLLQGDELLERGVDAAAAAMLAYSRAHSGLCSSEDCLEAMAALDAWAEEVRRTVTAGDLGPTVRKGARA